MYLPMGMTFACICPIQLLSYRSLSLSICGYVYFGSLFVVVPRFYATHNICVCVFLLHFCEYVEVSLTMPPFQLRLPTESVL